MLSITPHQKRALEYKHHISLTANAGSGKTFVLSKRYLQIIENEDISLREIAAITFTDKAASELYKRIAFEVEKILKTDLSQFEYLKWNNIRRELVSAHISTIHSFCVDVLKQFPVEAGIDANFTPIDQTTSNELIELAIDEEIKKYFHDEDKISHIKKVIRVLGSVNVLNEVIVNLIKERRKIPFIKEKIYKNSIEKVIEFYSKKYDEKLNQIFLGNFKNIIEYIKLINDKVLTRKNDNKYGIEIGRLLTEITENNNLKVNLNILKNIGNHLLTSKNKLRIQSYLKHISKDEYLNEKDLIEKYFEKISKINFKINEEEANKKLADFSICLLKIFQSCIDNYSQRKNDMGYLDYEDILLFTKKITSVPNVLDELSKKFKYIMIDEYQDTNELQYGIFLPVLDYLKKGNLFIVGDEKQSIYSFRDADLNIFNKTKSDIKNLEGNDFLLSLPDSFRMSPVISAFTNYVFEKLFEKPDPLYNEVNYSELVCANSDEIDGRIELLIARKDVNSEEEISESELVAKRILKLVNLDKWEISESDEKREIQWQDISILCRRRKHFKELETSFIKYGIPYTIVGGQGFYQRQPIYDIYNYFSFLLDEKNDTALIGILRSPFFNLSDADLFEISLEQGENFWQKLKNNSKSNKKQNEITKILDENINLAAGSNFSFMLRKILAETPFISTLASRINGKQEIANLKKLILITNNYSQKPFTTLYDYVEHLKSAIEKISDESQSNLSLDSSAVKIMTLHQSKGLEFPAVILFKCGEQNINRNKKISVDREFGILSKIPSDEGYYKEFIEPPVLSLSNIINNKKEEAELKRLFYVGVTRAKYYLFISGSKKKEFPDKSFMGILSKVLKLEDREIFKISVMLKILINEENVYKEMNREIDLTIPLIKSVGPILSKKYVNSELSENEKIKVNISEISDQSSEEIISATKIAVYSQCPLKYKLTYDLGLTKLYENYKNYEKLKPGDNYEFNLSETISDKDNSINEKLILSSYPAELKGKLIHNILQKEIKYEVLTDFLNSVLSEKKYQFDLSSKAKSNLKEDIIYDIKLFYQSDIYFKINSAVNYKNEFEVYLKENDYFLYGIIDKIIFDGSSITLIDYKTDNINKDQINDRVQNYLPQLKFYAYIIKQLYPAVAQIDMNLIFIKHPDEPYHQSITAEEINSFEKYLNKAVRNMRENKYTKNLNHCTKCLFTDLTGKCIKK